jgi:GT2 family glycosyltransferase
MKISIVIPNFNGQNLLKNNLPKVIAAISEYEGEKEILITDDNSIDQSEKVVVEISEKNKNIPISFIPGSKNLGFSSNVNKGVNKASGEIIILLNTDVSPEKDFLDSLLEHFRDKQVFAVGCLEKSIEPDGNIILRGRGLGRWEKGFLRHRRGEVNKNDTLWVSGGSGAFRKEIWDKLGGLNSLYDPFYWEDIDLSYRALKSGYLVLFEPKSVVVHEHEKGTIKNKYSAQQVKAIAYRNQFIFTWLNLTQANLTLSHVFYTIFYLLKSLVTGDLLFIKGFFGALFLLNKILKSRNKNIALFVKKDNEVIDSLE